MKKITTKIEVILTKVVDQSLESLLGRRLMIPKQVSKNTGTLLFRDIFKHAFYSP